MVVDFPRVGGMYPPEPWDLRGQMYLSVFAVPRSVLAPLPGPLAAAVRRPGQCHRELGSQRGVARR
jgi:hypothetical protein